MLQTMFLTVVNMSITASAAILLVLGARLLLRRAPKVFSYALWAVVLFRLLCPVSPSSVISLYNVLEAPAAEAGPVGHMAYLPLPSDGENTPVLPVAPTEQGEDAPGSGGKPPRLSPVRRRPSLASGGGNPGPSEHRPLGKAPPPAPLRPPPPGEYLPGRPHPGALCDGAGAAQDLPPLRPGRGGTGLHHPPRTAPHPPGRPPFPASGLCRPVRPLVQPPGVAGLHPGRPGHGDGLRRGGAPAVRRPDPGGLLPVPPAVLRWEQPFHRRAPRLWRGRYEGKDRERHEVQKAHFVHGGPGRRAVRLPDGLSILQSPVRRHAARLGLRHTGRAPLRGDGQACPCRVRDAPSQGTGDP